MMLTPSQSSQEESNSMESSQEKFEPIESSQEKIEDSDVKIYKPDLHKWDQQRAMQIERERRAGVAKLDRMFENVGVDYWASVKELSEAKEQQKDLFQIEDSADVKIYKPDLNEKNNPKRFWATTMEKGTWADVAKRNLGRRCKHYQKR